MMFIEEIGISDIKLIQEFEKRIVNKLDESTFFLGMEIVERIIKQTGAKMSVVDCFGENVPFKFNDITFHNYKRNEGCINE